MTKHFIWVLALGALTSCAESSADSNGFAKPPPGGPPPLTVELGAVTLADDCAPPTPPPASPPVNRKPSEAPAAPQKVAPGSMVPGAAYRGHCDQTTMQLSIKTPTTFKASTVKIKKVELLDAKGAVLQVLASRAPRTWAKTGIYTPWDEKVAGGTTTSVMYDLAAPDWNKLTNGRWNAHSMTFKVRVTIDFGSSTQTVTKQSITAARLPPPVPT